MKGVLVVEDVAFQREYLRHTVAVCFPEHQPILEAVDGMQAVEVALRHRPLLIIMDIQLPVLNGIKAAQTIWTESPLTRILFWSQFKDEAYLRELRKIVPGETVYGYMLKDSSEHNLTQAMRAILEDEQCWIDRNVRGVQSRVENSHTGLTDVEYEALIDISLGLTDKAIARRRYLSERGVQNRLRELYTKLEVDNHQIQHEDWGFVFNPRSRAKFIALSRGLINAELLDRENEEFKKWLKMEVGLEI